MTDINRPARSRAVPSVMAWQDAGPFAAGWRVSAGDLILLSGQTARESDGRFPANLCIREQTRLAFTTIAELLMASGSSLHQVVKLTYYVINMTDWPHVAAVRAEFLRDHRPASTALEVRRLFDPGCLIEIDVIATAAATPSP